MSTKPQGPTGEFPGPDLHKCADPKSEELLKGRPEDESAAATPLAGRSTLDQAKKKGIRGYFQLLGPGLVTGASDDDPSGIGTYSQTGSQFGYSVLWTALFTFPLMAAVQELCARIALQMGVGLGVGLKRKFPTWLVGICILALFVANTINLGADLGAVGSGIELLSKGSLHAIWLIAPLGIGVIVFQLFFSYSVIFKVFKWLTLALFAYVVSVGFAHPDLVKTITSTLVPHIEFSQGFITALVAILGTTISPYLFFWQASSEVDEMKAAGQKTEKERRGIQRAELHAARFDIILGMAFSQLIMYCILLTGAAVLHAHGKTNVQTAQQAAEALQPIAGQYAFIIFALGLIGTGLLAIPILSASATYAVKEFLGFKGSLAVKAKYRPTFYAVMSLAVIGGVAMNFLGVDPIKALFITAVINGMVAPPLLFLIVLLGSDKKHMGAYVSGIWSKILTWTATTLMTLAAVALIITSLFVKGW